jgi:hypothetical protein
MDGLFVIQSLLSEESGRLRELRSRQEYSWIRSINACKATLQAHQLKKLITRNKKANK